MGVPVSRNADIFRELRPTLALSFPIVIGQVSQMLMGITDSVMIGRVGVVPQVDNLDPDFTVRENLVVYGRYFGLRAAQMEERIPRLLEFAALGGGAALGATGILLATLYPLSQRLELALPLGSAWLALPAALAALVAAAGVAASRRALRQPTLLLLRSG